MSEPQSTYQQYTRIVPAAEGGAPGVANIPAPGEFVYCAVADRPVTVIIGGRSVTMQAGDKGRIPDGFRSVTVRNYDENPIYCRFIIGYGDFERIHVTGEVTAQRGVRRADGRFASDTRFDLVVNLAMTDAIAKSFAGGDVIIDGPADPGQGLPGEFNDFENVTDALEVDDKLLLLGDARKENDSGNYPAVWFFDARNLTPESIIELSDEFFRFNSGVAEGFFALDRNRIYVVSDYENDEVWSVPITDIGADPQKHGVTFQPSALGDENQQRRTLFYNPDTSLIEHLVASDNEQWSIRKLDPITWEEIDIVELPTPQQGNWSNIQTKCHWQPGVIAFLPESTSGQAVFYDSRTLAIVYEEPGYPVINRDVRAWSAYRNGFHALSDGVDTDGVHTYAARPFTVGGSMFSIGPCAGRLQKTSDTAVIADVAASRLAPGRYQIGGEVIRAALDAEFLRQNRGRVGDDYLDHVYRFVGPYGQEINSGDETFMRAGIEDSFTLTVPGQVRITIDNELARG